MCSCLWHPEPEQDNELVLAKIPQSHLAGQPKVRRKCPVVG